MCYWEGGGKEGQFPPGFRKRGGLKGSASNTRQGSFKPTPTTHTMITNPEVDQVFVCMTIEDTKFKVPAATNLDKLQIPNDNVPPSSSNQPQQKHDAIDKGELRVLLGESPIVCHADPTNKSSIPTLLDSGASDHCFADMSLFTSYTLFDQPTPGLTAEKGLTFKVAGKGNVKLQTDINGIKRIITFHDVLYTPSFQYNLISLARMSIKGAEICFKDNKATVKTNTGVSIISATRSGQLYVVDMDKIQPSALMTQSKCRPTNFTTWHRCLVHAGTDTIHQMISKRLIDGLDVSGEPSIGGLCEDCIYGKHTAHPFHKNKLKESAVLKHVHINIWGPCQIQSAGGATYFMIIMDGFSSYRTVAFLKHKSAETTLKIFKNF